MAQATDLITWDEAAVQQKLTRMVERTMTDVEFRRMCIRFPGAAFEATFGVTLPVGLTLRFAESAAERSEHAHVIVLPPFLGDVAELSDESLERVSGGASGQASDSPLVFNLLAWVRREIAHVVSPIARSL